MKEISNVSNDVFIGTKETAELLGISLSTVRRLANTGKLQCYTIPYNKYRKFKIDEVQNFKKQNLIKFTKENTKVVEEFGDQLALNLNDEQLTSDDLKQIKAKSHPAHYLMHKYWGRKPHNVVADYIEYYTNPGDTVLDPFAGSGMAPIEAIKANRIGIGVDINPMSAFIATNTVSEVNLSDYKRIAHEVLLNITTEYSHLYETTCPDCNSQVQIETAVWKEGTIARIRGKCSIDGTFIKDADEKDIALYKNIQTRRKIADNEGTINYPKDKVLKYVKRSGKESIDELFTDRALIILSGLKQRIHQEENTAIKSLLMFTFTSMLANVSNMLPGDLEKSTYKSGWVISKFWTPKVHTERNIFHCFKLRVKAILKGKKELSHIDSSLLNYYIRNSNDLSMINDSTIDYIFTDPPYGESIAYLALSQFWNSWLDNLVDYENEIIIDTYRGKNYIDYAERMLKTFNELYRVLKPNHYMSFTFHNRDLNVWKAVMDACKGAGFVLSDITLQEQAVSSGTQGINKMNTLTGDFVYTLHKPLNKQLELNKVKIYDSKVDNLAVVKKIISNLVNEHESITPSKLYEKLLPIIIKEETYIDTNGKAIDIEKILKEDYEYVLDSSNTKLGDSYVWKVKK